MKLQYYMSIIMMILIQLTLSSNFLHKILTQEEKEYVQQVFKKLDYENKDDKKMMDAIFVNFNTFTAVSESDQILYDEQKQYVNRDNYNIFSYTVGPHFDFDPTRLYSLYFLLPKRFNVETKYGCIFTDRSTLTPRRLRIRKIHGLTLHDAQKMLLMQHDSFMVEYNMLLTFPLWIRGVVTYKIGTKHGEDYSISIKNRYHYYRVYNVVGNSVDQSDVNTNDTGSNLVTLYDFIHNLEPIVNISNSESTTTTTTLEAPRIIQEKKKKRNKSWCSCRKNSTICALV